MNRWLSFTLAWVVFAPCAAFAQLSISPAAPQMLDPVRVAIPRTGTFTFDPDSVHIELANGKFTVHVKFGAALSPPPPPSTFEVLLGQLPMGTYAVDVVLDTPIPSSLGAASFTVGPRTGPLPTYSDLWWNSGESGWGLNIVQHPSDTAFATLFVYDAGGSGAPRWYVMPELVRPKTSSQFSGPIYRTTGPQVLDSFDPAAVTRALVGMASIYLSGNSATLTVTIDGRTVTKTLTREAF